MKEEGLNKNRKGKKGVLEGQRLKYRNTIAGFFESNLAFLRKEYLDYLGGHRKVLSDGVENIFVDFDCFRKEAIVAMSSLLTMYNLTEIVREAQPPWIFELEEPSNGKVLVMELKLIDSEESTKEGQ